MNRPVTFIFIAACFCFGTKAAAQATQPADLSVALAQGSDGRIVVRFTNASKTNLVVFRPLDGSEYGWLWPHYQFLVFDEAGKEVPLPVRCGLFGLWSNTRWPQDYQLTVEAGTVLELPLRIPQIDNPGVYRVRFAYEFAQKPAKHFNAQHPPPPGTWFGRAEAPETTIRIPSR